MRRRRCGGGGPTVSVRGGEIANRLASDEVGDELPFLDKRDALGLHALVVEGVVAKQRLPGNCGDRRVVEQVDEDGQHARLVAAGPFPRGAGVLAELRLSAKNIRLHEFGDNSGGGVVREQNWAAVFLIDDRGVTQRLQRSEDAGGGLEKLFAGGEILEIVRSEEHT